MPPFCPVITDHGTCEPYDINYFDGTGFECKCCGGKYEIERRAFIDYFGEPEKLSPFYRAVLSHHLANASRDNGFPRITKDWMERFQRDARLPSPPKQATNFIRLIGDRLSTTGEGYVYTGEIDVARVGAFNLKAIQDLIRELGERNLIQKTDTARKPDGAPLGTVYGLTLDGWKRYEAERRGQFAGGYGFIAMKFDEPKLDEFVEQIVKPAVREDIKYNLVDMRDVSQAGVIDNIMRVKIRDAAFVLADLTHDNYGAYWEAGYAEGLGKPVVYLCEREKFKNYKTHFDTNHSTTVVWSVDEPGTFRQQLIATLRRSLNLFPTAESE